MKITDLIIKGSNDIEAKKLLIKILKDNGYKPTSSSATIMLDSISELISPEVYNYYSVVATQL